MCSSKIDRIPLWYLFRARRRSVILRCRTLSRQYFLKQTQGFLSHQTRLIVVALLPFYIALLAAKIGPDSSSHHFCLSQQALRVLVALESLCIVAFVVPRPADFAP